MLDPRGWLGRRGRFMTEGLRCVYLVDDDQLVRKTIVGILQAENFQVSEFPSAVEFLSAVDSLDFGTVLLDVKMPGMDGLELLAELNKREIQLPIVMVSGYGDISMAVKAVKAGAVDFIEKPFEPDELVAAIEASRSQFDQLNSNDGDPFENTALGILSKREQQVLRLLLDGDQNKVIAYKLDISPRTVEFHRAKMMKRLSVNTFAELVRVAVSSGM